jgi:hypothetical protein
MNRLGQLLRNFIRKLAQNYILPNQNTPSKLNEVPAKYSAIIKAEDWINFVFAHLHLIASYYRLYWFILHVYVFYGYKIERKEIEPEEEPPRGTLWLKGREKKDGEYHDDEIRTVGEKIVSFTKSLYYVHC